jgi:hypothetical protein
MYQLKNWYFEKKAEKYRVWGNVYGDDRFTEGQWIHTSSIREISTERGALIIRTGNSQYMAKYSDHKDVDLRVLSMGLRDYLWPDNEEVYDKITGAEKRRAKHEIRRPVTPDDLSVCSVFTFSSEVVNGFICLDIKRRGKVYHTISYDLHKGMYQDYLDVNDPNLDYEFRFFAYQKNAWQFDPFPEKYQPVFLKNAGKQTITASTAYGEFTVMPGDTVLLGTQAGLERVTSEGGDEPSFEKTMVINHESLKLNH